MDRDHPEPMTPFDELVTSPELQMIKLLIPFFPSSGQQVMAAWVKCAELKAAVALFRVKPGALRAQELWEGSPSSPDDILNLVRPYLTPGQQSMLDMIIRIREMMPLMEMMQNTAQSGDGDPAFRPEDFLTAFLSPEQQEMFQMYSEMFSQGGENMQKGENTDERMDEQSGNEEYRSGETGADPDGG